MTGQGRSHGMRHLSGITGCCHELCIPWDSFVSGNQRGNCSLTCVWPCPLPFPLALLKAPEGSRGWEQGLCWSQRHSQSCPCLLGTRLGLVKIESVDHLREGTELITQPETSGPTVPRQTLGSSNGSTVSMLVSTITWEESSTRNYLDHVHVRACLGAVSWLLIKVGRPPTNVGGTIP